MRSLINIDKSILHRGEYVGYADGPWRIRRDGKGWRATRKEAPFATFRKATLREVSHGLSMYTFQAKIATVTP